MRILSPGPSKNDPVGSSGRRGLPPTIAAVQPPQTAVQHRKLSMRTVGAGVLMSTTFPNIFTFPTQSMFIHISVRYGGPKSVEAQILDIHIRQVLGYDIMECTLRGCYCNTASPLDLSASRGVYSGLNHPDGGLKRQGYIIEFTLSAH